MKRAFIAIAALASAISMAGCGSTTFPAPKTLTEGPPLRRFTPGAAQPASVAKESPRALAWKMPKHPSPTERRLANGIRVILAPRHDFPTATVLFVLDRGESAGPPGVASLYARAMTGDSQAYDAQEAHEYLRYVGATVQGHAYEDSVILEVSALAPLLASALSRATPMFVSPKFDNDTLDRARTTFPSKDEDDRPGVVARRTLLRALFPAPHPYGRRASMTSAHEVAATKRDALTSFRDMYLTTERVHVVVTGDFDPDAIMRTLEKHMANVPHKAASTAPSLPDVTSACAGSIAVVDRPGSVQSSIAIGWPSVAADDPDGAALGVLSAATGGWLSSRLNLTVRKELGASYGVHASLSALRTAGTLELTSAVDTPRTADALSGMLRETDRLRAEPLGGDELDVAKMKASSGDDSSSGHTLAFRLARAAALGLPIGFVEQHAARVDAVSADDVRLAAEKWLAPTKRCVVVVGDASKIVPAISALGVGKVDVVRAAPR